VKRVKEVARFFLRTKPSQMLILLRKGPKYATLLSKEVDVTYSHTVKLLDIFNDLGLVEFEKKGRIKMVKLTALGEEIAKTLDSLMTKFNKIRASRKL